MATRTIMQLHICDDCCYAQHIDPKRPAESGSKSYPCGLCGHLGIGSKMYVLIGPWLKEYILPANYELQPDDLLDFTSPLIY